MRVQARVNSNPSIDNRQLFKLAKTSHARARREESAIRNTKWQFGSFQGLILALKK